MILKKPGEIFRRQALPPGVVAQHRQIAVKRRRVLLAPAHGDGQRRTVEGQRDAQRIIVRGAVHVRRRHIGGAIAQPEPLQHHDPGRLPLERLHRVMVAHPHRLAPGVQYIPRETLLAPHLRGRKRRVGMAAAQKDHIDGILRLGIKAVDAPALGGQHLLRTQEQRQQDAPERQRADKRRQAARLL